MTSDGLPAVPHATTRAAPRGLGRFRTSGGIAISLVLLVLTFAPTAQSSTLGPRPVVDPYLQAVLPGMGPTDSVPVIVSFWRAADRPLLAGDPPPYHFRPLPMAG